MHANANPKPTGLDRDEDKALEWLKKAAIAGNGAAMACYAHMLRFHKNSNELHIKNQTNFINNRYLEWNESIPNYLNALILYFMF